MDKVKRNLFFFGLAFVFLTGCGKKEELSTETIEEIQKRSGVPVRVVPAGIELIREIRKYSGDIEGIHQKSIHSQVPEYIKQVNVSVGSRVKKDQLLVELDSRGNTPTYRQAEAAHEIAKKSYDRLKNIYDEGGISQQQLDEVETQYKMAKANFDAASKITRILAPFTGVVTDLNARQGDIAPMDKPLLTVANIGSVIFRMDISDQEIHLFSLNIPVSITVGDKDVLGKITKIPLAADSRTRSFKVEATFTNPGARLKPGMYVEASVITRQDSSLCVPMEAIQFEGEKTYAYLVTDSQAVRTEITTGIMSGSKAEVASGLKPSDQVVVDGISKLAKKTKIKIVE
ncbi:efflux RND transporter periplasmic adaptor subunit [Fibrobacterota bacterium]